MNNEEPNTGFTFTMEDFESIPNLLRTHKVLVGLPKDCQVYCRKAENLLLEATSPGQRGKLTKDEKSALLEHAFYMSSSFDAKVSWENVEENAEGPFITLTPKNSFLEEKWLVGYNVQCRTNGTRLLLEAKGGSERVENCTKDPGGICHQKNGSCDHVPVLEVEFGHGRWSWMFVLKGMFEDLASG